MVWNRPSVFDITGQYYAKGMKLRGLDANTLLGNISSCFHRIYLWPSHCSYGQGEGSWGVHKLVQCVSIQYTADRCFLKPRNGLLLQERGVSANASETKDFQIECLCSWHLISATSFPARKNTNFSVTNPQSPGNCWEASIKITSIVYAITSIQIQAHMEACLPCKIAQAESSASSCV